VPKVKHCKLCGNKTAEAAFKLKDGTIYSCQSCDFHFLDQLDEIDVIENDSKGLTDHAWNYIEARVNGSASLLPKRLELVKEFVDLPGARCLDLGAGIGQFLVQLQKEQAEGVGIEPSAVRREYAERKFGLKLRKELADDNYWQADFAEHFDVVCLWDVIEHVNFPAKTLQMASQLLKRGGYLFLDTPNRVTASYRLSEKVYRLSGGQLPLFLENFYSTAPYCHKQIFTAKQLRQLGELLGLQISTLRHSYVTNLLRGKKLILAYRKPEEP